MNHLGIDCVKVTVHHQLVKIANGYVGQLLGADRHHFVECSLEIFRPNGIFVAGGAAFLLTNHQGGACGASPPSFGGFLATILGDSAAICRWAVKVTL